MFGEWKALALQAMIRSIFRAEPIVPALFVFAGRVEADTRMRYGTPVRPPARNHHDGNAL
jgi:hypothetical protein